MHKAVDVTFNVLMITGFYAAAIIVFPVGALVLGVLLLFIPREENKEERHI